MATLQNITQLQNVTGLTIEKPKRLRDLTDMVVTHEDATIDIPNNKLYLYQTGVVMSTETFGNCFLQFTSNYTRFTYAMIRCSTLDGKASGDHIGFRFQQPPPQVTRVCLNGTETSINSNSQSATTYWGGVVVRLEMIGDTMRVYRNGVELPELATTQAGLAEGYIGFCKDDPYAVEDYVTNVTFGDL